MKFLFSALTILASSIHQVHAFTNGTILPSYICGPNGDGFPKSLGGVLPLFQEYTNPGPVTADGILPNHPLDKGAGGSLLNTQLLLAGFHNKVVITPYEKVIAVNIIAVADPNLPSFVPVPQQIVPGFNHTVQLVATPNDLGIQDPVNFALDGAVVYGYDNAHAQRVGTFNMFGPAMQPWIACGPNNVGVVHTGLLSCTGVYDGLQWYAPLNLVPGTNITFKGAAVTDNGFGAHSTTVNVVAPPVRPPPQPSITKVFLFGAFEAFAFFIDESRGSTTVPAATFQLTSSLSASITGTPVASSMVTTCPASPCVSNVAQLLQKAGLQGGYLTLTVVALSKTAVASLPSNPVEFPVGLITIIPTTTPTTTAPTLAPTTTTATTAAPTTTTATTTTPTTAAPTTKLATTKTATTKTPTTATATTATPTTATATTATPTTAQPTTAAPTTATPTTATPTTAATTFTAATLAQHNTAASCWVAINAQIYDLTNYINNHPGGAGQITMNCGVDASAAYAGIGAHQPAKLATTNTVVLIGPLVNALVTNQLIVANNYQSPSKPAPLTATTMDGGFAALCDTTYSQQVNSYQMSLADDPDGACAFQATFTNAMMSDAGSTAVMQVQGVDPGTSSSSSNNQAVIIGVSVGVAVFIVGVAAIVAVYIYKKGQKSNGPSNVSMIQTQQV